MFMITNWNGIGGNVLIVMLVVLGLRHLEKMMTSADNGIAEDHLLHRLVWRYPRPSSECKPVTDVNAHSQAKRIGLHECHVYHPPEVLAQRIRLALVFRTLCRSTNRHQIAAAQSHILHGLEVGLDACLRYGAIHPVPEGPGLCSVSRTDTK